MNDARHFEQAAKAMIAAQSAGRSVAAVLKRRCPMIFRHLTICRSQAAALKLWGLSVNNDELANATIVAPAILQAVGEIAGVAMTGNIVHAGLQHTYGYLFSLIETPFGYKRDRWINELLDSSFGFDRRVLHALPDAGTLLFNLTYFLTRIAFRGQAKEIRRVRNLRGATAPELLVFPYGTLARQRLEETVTWKPKGAERRSVSLVTDIIRFPCDSSQAGLLIYSVRDSRQDHGKLITAFPISATGIAELTSPDTLGARTEIRTRYNAFVPGFHEESRLGVRSLHSIRW